jgi:hypothetical protein
VFAASAVIAIRTEELAGTALVQVVLATHSRVVEEGLLAIFVRSSWLGRFATHRGFDVRRELLTRFQLP